MTIAEGVVWTEGQNKEEGEIRRSGWGVDDEATGQGQGRIWRRQKRRSRRVVGR